MEKTDLIYQELQEEVKKKSELLKEIARARLSSLKRDGWKSEEEYEHLGEKKYGLRFWVQDAIETKNELKLKFLCVGGDERLEGLLLEKTIQKSNKHLLKSKYKKDEVFNVHYVRLDTENLDFEKIGFAGVTLCKPPKEIKIKRMEVEKRSCWY